MRNVSLSISEQKAWIFFLEARMQAQFILDDDELNGLLLKIVRAGETHGLKFPREFGLLLKQILYFDRYVKILAPTLEIVSDRRVDLGKGL